MFLTYCPECAISGSPGNVAKAGALMKLSDVTAKRKKKFKATTGSKYSLPITPNLLNRQFEVQEPGRILCCSG